MDVSAWQGTINYAKAKNEIQFVIPRIGFGQTTDTKFRRNVEEARNHGIDIPAVYHFSYALSNEDAVKEADYAISEVEFAKLPKSTIIFYDFEYDSLTYAKKKNVPIGNNDVNAFTIAFCNRCLEKGYRTGIYLNNDFYKNYYHKTTLEKYSIWLADWSGGPDHPCYIQQYTSTGRVSGVNGNVDMNYIFDLPSYDLHEVALEVIAGKWGNGEDRKKNLQNAGFSYKAVQAEVNMILNGNAATALDPNRGSSVNLKNSKDKVGTYEATEELYIRKAAGTNKTAVCKIPKGTKVYCCGFYDIVSDKVWLYVHCTPFEDRAVYAGFCCKEYLTRIEE